MSSVIFKRPPLRKLKKEGFFGVDMHFHTKYSLDAVSRIPSAVKKAKKKGFGFAITDHNSIKGVLESYRFRKQALIIPGVEITCRNGNHLLAYFYAYKELEEFFSKKIRPLMKSPFFVNVSPSEFLNISKDYNCLVCAAHPFAPGATGIKRTKNPKSFEKNVDLIEVLNGFNFRNANIKAVYWASQINKSMTGGSDGHSTFQLGKVLTFTKSDDIDDIFYEIKKNRSIIIGKEDNLFIKAVMILGKEGAYVKRSKKQKMAMNLLKLQLGSEYRHVREKFGNLSSLRMILDRHQKNGDN